MEQPTHQYIRREVIIYYFSLFLSWVKYRRFHLDCPRWMKLSLANDEIMFSCKNTMEYIYSNVSRQKATITNVLYLDKT